MATIEVPKNTFTVADAAQRFGKDESHIRRVCIDHDLGTVMFGRIRLLKPADIRRLEKHFREVGRNREKKSGV